MPSSRSVPVLIPLHHLEVPICTLKAALFQGRTGLPSHEIGYTGCLPAGQLLSSASCITLIQQWLCEDRFRMQKVEKIGELYLVT